MNITLNRLIIFIAFLLSAVFAGLSISFFKSPVKEELTFPLLSGAESCVQTKLESIQGINRSDLSIVTFSNKPMTVVPVSGYGEALELLVPNRIGTHCYPTAEYNFAQSESNLRTISISRFTVIGKNLVEFAMILNVKKDVSGSEAEAYARRIMDGYWRSLEVI